MSWIAVLRKTSCPKQYCSRGGTYEFKNFAVRRDLDRDCAFVRTVGIGSFLSVCCGRSFWLIGTLRGKERILGKFCSFSGVEYTRSVTYASSQALRNSADALRQLYTDFRSHLAIWAAAETGMTLEPLRAPTCRHRTLCAGRSVKLGRACGKFGYQQRKEQPMANPHPHPLPPRWKPGQSGNPSGRPKGLAHYIQDKTHKGRELIDWYLAIWRAKKNPSGASRNLSNDSRPPRRS